MKISQIRPSIFLLSFPTQYQMAMHFLRYQEYYECPSPKFRGKSFALLDYMEWYQKEYGNGLFTYPKDWSGFNFPGHIIRDVMNKGIDYNDYDEAMVEAYYKCQKINGSDHFYIIGGVGKETLGHEIAHGLYYLSSDYKEDMNKLISLLPKNVIREMQTWLKSVGYPKKVYKDEMQAYLSTGLTKELEHLEKYRKPFIDRYLLETP